MVDNGIFYLIMSEDEVNFAEGLVLYHPKKFGIYATLN